LEVDGQHHQNGEQTLRDYVRDRVLLREGIPTARFTAEDCFNRSAEVVDEFLGMFSPAQAVKWVAIETCKMEEIPSFTSIPDACSPASRVDC
jgi:hypothetical protein